MGLYLTYKLEDQNREKLYEGQIKSFILNKEDETYVEKFINSIREKNFNYSLAILYKRWNKIENEDLKKDLINKITGETGQSSSSKEKTSACQKIINLKEIRNLNIKIERNLNMKTEIPDPTPENGIRASEDNIGIQELLDAEEYERNRKSQEDWTEEYKRLKYEEKGIFNYSEFNESFDSDYIPDYECYSPRSL